ncbi:MAG: hypothetical protein WC967_12410 [Balneolaceae bacterium]
MKSKITRLRKNCPLLFKLSLVLLYIVFHILVSRPVRTTIFSLQITPSLVEKVEQHPSFSFPQLGPRYFYIEYIDQNIQNIWRYTVPFGSFFLFGMVGLILMGAHKNMFLILILAHTLIFLITWLVFATDLLSNPYLLNIPDFLSRYIAPLSALGVIPLALMTKTRSEGSQ